MKHKIAVLAIIALTIVGCNSTKNTTGMVEQNNGDLMTQMSQSTWQLIRLDGETINQSNMDEKIEFKLNTADQTVSGYSGCNNFNGTYLSEAGNKISFTQLASTRRACPEGQVNEQKVLDVFNKANNFTIQGNNLMLNRGARPPLAIFKKK